MKDKKIIFGITLVFIFLASVGFSYAYFSSAITNKDVKDQVVETGTLQLTYTDGPEIVMNNIKPGTSITKEVSVKNTGTLDTAYNLVWQELANEIINDEMVIEATCTRLNANGVEEGTCESLSSTPIKRIKIKENFSIEPNITHKYNITITFKEISADQNYNQGKNFTGTLGVNEYVENTPCTFDGELTQGVEYVNGQYTYKYMQEYVPNYDATSDDEIILQNIDNGWSVFLTDKESTNPVTSKLCTYINNEPVTSMSLMFYQSKAKVLDLSSFDTSNVTDMSYMFYRSYVYEIDVSNFNTSKVTNMEGMFASSNVSTLDLSNFNTSKVTDMSSMFAWSKASEIKGLNKFNTSNVTDMSSMFYRSYVYEIDVSNFNTSNVTDMAAMFAYTSATTLDVSSFDTSNVSNMNWMFSNSSNLKHIYVSDKFVTTNVTDDHNMFKNSPNLVGGAGTIYDSTKIDKTYARVDGGTSSPGYFTLKTN